MRLRKEPEEILLGDLIIDLQVSVISNKERLSPCGVPFLLPGLREAHAVTDAQTRSWRLVVKVARSYLTALTQVVRARISRLAHRAPPDPERIRFLHRAQKKTHTIRAWYLFSMRTLSFPPVPDSHLNLHGLGHGLHAAKLKSTEHASAVRMRNRDLGFVSGEIVGEREGYGAFLDEYPVCELGATMDLIEARARLPEEMYSPSETRGRWLLLIEIKSHHLMGRRLTEPLEICLRREISHFPDAYQSAGIEVPARRS